MRAAVAILALTGCHELFGLREINRTDTFEDAPVLFEYDGAVPLDTAGWPTNGGVGALVCPPSLVSDEDGDLRDDACDNCPLDANDQTDTDRDGIGDLCDPHPMFAVERRALFDGFNADSATGEIYAGNWVIENGLLRQTGTGTGRQMFVITAGMWREPTLQLRFGNARRNGTVTTFWAGAYLIAGGALPTSSEPDGIQCRVHYGGGSTLEMMRFREQDPTETSTASLPRVNDDVSLMLGATKGFGAPPECAGARDTLPSSTLTSHLLLTTDATDPAPATFALWTVAARIDVYGIDILETTYP